jgi:hypothetical protein
MELALVVAVILLFELAVARWAVDSRDYSHKADPLSRLGGDDSPFA